LPMSLIRKTSQKWKLWREKFGKTGTAVVVVTVPSIGENQDYNLYANELYKHGESVKKARIRAF